MTKKAKGTPLTEREVIVLAAWFARSNMGMERAKREDVVRLLNQNHVSLDGAVVALCQEFMESDEHYDIFMSEAKSWQRDMKKRGTREAVLGAHHDVERYFWPKEENAA